METLLKPASSRPHPPIVIPKASTASSRRYPKKASCSAERYNKKRAGTWKENPSASATDDLHPAASAIEMQPVPSIDELQASFDRMTI
ncbi:hypothetical protein CROQUDRAFT_94681 [Cronartium quercuum f. sp. fusiforme G11]|uniref:Uncharacterized protein n=1 Tax=Cronartium quercuum f. sp. fusiforme G11 TaxID=708437 RepID=A0A9P6NFR2_9BASI|nr:hypothetical protein CROQUDRAFT_94681 [Cronartium quercuum f. sp. fusiforme G11]